MSAAMNSVPPPRRGERAASRALSLFAHVEPHEVANVAVLSLSIFLLLCAYYLLKTAREPLILLGGGAEVKSYAAAGQAVLLLGFVRVYGSIAKRVGRMKLLASVYLFFVATLLAFAALAAAKVPIGVPFYLWTGVFNYTAIAQLWAFAADIYTPAQGKRLFTLLGIGSAVGAVVGARIARSLVKHGPQMLMLVATALLVVCLLALAWVDRNGRRSASAPAEASAPDAPIAGGSAFALLARDKYLLLLAALTLVLNFVNSNGEYLLDRSLLARTSGLRPDAAAALIGEFKADYFGWVNLVGVVLQLFVVSRLMTRLGPRVVLFLLPVVALGGYGALIGAPVLAVVRIAKIAENSLDYSAQNTARQALYLVTTREEKFVGKTAVDTFFVRFGDVLSAALVGLGARLSLSTPGFAAINAALVVVWLVIVAALGREHRVRSGEAPRKENVRTPGRAKRVVAATVLVAAMGSAANAHASPAKRELPDYEGRDPAPTTASDVGLYAPRVTLAPVHLVFEYGVRRPLGAAIADAERAHVPAQLYDFFLFGPEHKAGIVPAAFLDFGFNPSVGVYAFWDDALMKGHDLKLHASTWGDDWLAGSFTEGFRVSSGDALTLRFAGTKRPDHMFFGVGPDTVSSNISRYGEDMLEAGAKWDAPLWRSSKLETSIGVRSVDLRHGHFGSDPSVEQRAAAGGFALPDGFGRGYTAATSRISGALDSRRPRPAPGSGVRFELEAEEGADVRRQPSSAWVRYGATAGGFLDLNGRNRVLSASVSTRFADPLGHEPIPFTELVSLGGDGAMAGFYPGRLVDRSAAVASVRYRWPIWVWLDGSVQAATGNVFGDHLDQLRASRLRLSGTVGVESVGSNDGSFELLVGVGTETFDQGANVDTVRIAVGTNHGF